MSTMTEPTTTQVYRVYIRTTPEAVWDAITKPEWTERYGYQGVADYDLRAGGRANITPGRRDAGVRGHPGRRSSTASSSRSIRRAGSSRPGGC